MNLLLAFLLLVLTGSAAYAEPPSERPAQRTQNFSTFEEADPRGWLTEKHKMLMKPLLDAGLVRFASRRDLDTWLKRASEPYKKFNPELTVRIHLVLSWATSAWESDKAVPLG